MCDDMLKHKEYSEGGGGARLATITIWQILAVVVAGGWLTGFLFLKGQKSEQEKYRDQLTSLAAIHAKQLEGELRGCLVTTRALQQYLADHESVSRADFAAFVKPLLSERSEIQALEWVPFVPEAGRQHFEELAGRELAADYAIREHTQDGRLIPASKRDDYYPVYYIEPSPGNEKASGFDLGSDTLRRASLESARDQGAMQVTGRIRLIQEPGEQYGFLLFGPVYKKGLPLGSAEERRAALTGFALGVFRSGDILGAALAPNPYPDLTLSFMDLSAPGDQREFHVRRSGLPKGASWFPFLYPRAEPVVISFRFAGRLFGLQVMPHENYVRHHYSLAYAMFLPAGITGSVLMGFMFYRLVLRRRQFTDALRRRDVQLDESHQREQILTEGLPVGAILWDLDFKVQGWNPAAGKIFGYSRGEAIGKHAGFIIPEQSRKGVDQVWNALITAEGGQRSTNENLTKAGALITCDWYNIATRRADGSISGVVSFVEDITARIQTEVVRQRYQMILQHARDAVLLMSLEGRFVEVNEAAQALYGYSRAEMLERGIRDLRPHEAPETIRLQMERARTSGLLFEAEHRRKDGSVFPVEVSSRGVQIGGEEFLLSICRDLSPRRKAEAALRESEQRLTQIAKVAGELIWEINPEGRYTYVSNVCMSLLGYEAAELVGKLNYNDLVPDEQREEAQAQFFLNKEQHEMISAFPRQMKRKDGQEIKVLTSAIPMLDDNGLFLGYRGCDLDITAQDSLERQLRQAQKMEAVATLAGGIAHDFNNMLFAIMGFTSIAMQQAGNNKQLLDDLQQILLASRRSSDLVKQLLVFSRQVEKQSIEVAVTPILKETNRLLRGAIPATVDIVTELRAVRDSIIADPVQIQQVIMNLGSNAYHAMRENGGTLTLKLENVARDAVRGHPGGAAGWLCLSVKDTGCGIDPSHRDRLFEPFFTTKGIGEGTGLGLAVVHGIVTASNGFIEVDSRVGKGTTFRVYFPVLDETSPGSTQLPEVVPVPGEGRHVLYVDDETSLIQMMRRALETFGYRVTACSNGAEALRALRGDPSGFDALLTDYAMPGMTGLDLVEAARTIRPGLPIVMITGFDSEKKLVARCKELGVLLKFKPLESVDLGNAIHEAMARQSAGQPGVSSGAIGGSTNVN